MLLARTGSMFWHFQLPALLLSSVSLCTQAQGWTNVNPNVPTSSFGTYRRSDGVGSTLAGSRPYNADPGYKGIPPEAWEAYEAGRQLLFGEAGKRNIALGETKLKEAARFGVVPAKLLLGRIALSSEFGQPDPKVAGTWFKSAAKSGGEYEQLVYGSFLLSGKNHEADPWEGFNWTRKAAKGGLAEAQVQLGALLASGLGTRVNLQEAALWFRKAAEAGDPVGAWRLADCYEQGAGLATDPTEALHWRNEALRHGLTPVIYQLTVIDREGWGDKELLDRTRNMLRAEAEGGDAGSQFGMFLMLDRGIGVKADPAGATHWLEQSAAAGSPSAQLELGNRFATGHGAVKDASIAADWYEDASIAADWYEKAALNGEPRAMYLLGIIEFSGEGRPRNLASAFAWLSLAKEKNINSAEDALGQLRAAIPADQLAAGVRLLSERAATWTARAPAAK